MDEHKLDKPAIIVTLLVLSGCIKLIYDYNVLGKYHDAPWGVKSLIILALIWSIISLFNLIKSYFKNNKAIYKQE